MKKFFTFNVLAVLLIFMVSASAWCDGVVIGPGELPQWHANSQVQLGWIFTDPINPQNSAPLSGWDEAIGEIPVWDYDADRMAWGHPGQYYILINNLVNNNPVKHMWISWIYDFDTLASGTRVATNIDWYPFTGLQDHGLVDEWFDSSGNPTTNYLNAVYGRITFNLDLYPNPEYEEIWLGLYSNTHYVREVYVKTLCVEACEGDFDGDGDVDGSDLAAFAANFGRTDCGVPTTCQGDFDNDGDVDGSDLAVFAADFGRTDCPTLD